MKNLQQILAWVVLIMISTTNASYAAVETVSCSSDPSYAANSCDQCFSGGTAAEWEVKGFLTDIWKNNSDGAQVAFKEEQVMPKIISLNGASWTDITAGDGVDFWQYTPEFEALYSESDEGYVLDAGESVTWIESTLGSGYQLSSSSASEGQNVGMIVYDIGVHNILAWGDPAIETDTHRECVLIKAGAATPTPAEPGTPTQPSEPGQPTPQPTAGEPTVLPETGPEHVFLALAALLLWFGFFYFKRKA